MNQKKLNYIHYYLLAIVTSILVWGGFEYITICNGQNCMIDANRLWKGLAIITLIFIPITLCTWSTYVNSNIKFILNNLKIQINIQYEEKTLLFAILIFVALFAASLTIFNVYWNFYVGNDLRAEGDNFTSFGKEYMAATANVAVFVATLFAPIAALILYDNWKVQHNKNIDTIYYQEAIASLKEVSSSFHEIKRILDEDSSDNILNEYKKLRKKYLDNLSKLQSTILFIDLIENNNKLESLIFKPFINNARNQLLDIEPKYSVLEQMDSSNLKNHIANESKFHGKLIKDNIESIVRYLNEKVKA